MVAPEFAELLVDIKDQFKGLLSDKATPLAMRLAVAKELRQTASDVLDRGGAPKLKQIQQHTVHESYNQLDEAQLMKLISKKLKQLDEGGRDLLVDVHPEFSEPLASGQD